jgi:Asp-tRNA(Asn)/Glu-tRNA(Gln) amidotransferase A subunit family amidase
MTKRVRKSLRDFQRDLSRGCRILQDLGALYKVPHEFRQQAVADDRADHDSEITARLKRAGLVIFGKTNTPSSAFARRPNPGCLARRATLEPAHGAGGSSGGAAAAVASGMLPMAHAEDGGGSIRVPASCCGLFRLKPTRARNPLGPDQGEGWGGASTAHAITRTVRDSAALLDATSGPDVGDPYWAPPPAGPFLQEVGRPPGRLRIALATASWNGAPVEPQCSAAARAAAALCESLGHRVEEACPQIDGPSLWPAIRVIIGANVCAALEARAKALGRTLGPDDVERYIWARTVDARSYTAIDYVSAIGVAHRAGRDVARFRRP